MAESPVPRRILIADDDTRLVDLLREFLIPRGFEIQIATNGKEALAQASTGSFDLVLLDVMMPLQDGYHVAAEIHASMGTRAPKILLMTARDARSERHFADLTGAVGILQKPFLLDELVALLSQHCP